MKKDQNSNPQFTRILSQHEYETFTFPKEILYDKRLTGNAVKLLLIILDYGKRPNWQLRQNHLIAVSGFGYDKYSAAIKCLEAAFYVRRKLNEKVKGRFSTYDYEFCAFPILTEDFKNISPIRVFRTGSSEPENPNLNYSSNTNVLEETTNPKEKKKVVSGSHEKLKELEEVKNISDSQKATLYKKFTHEQILTALNAVNLKKADSPFALLFKAIENNYQPNEKQSVRNQEAYEVYEKAVEFISQRDTRISLGIDEKYAYIYLGTASTSFDLNDPEFRKKFSDAINRDINKK